MRKAISCNPKYASAYGTLGYFYLEKRNVDLAIESFSKCLELNKNIWDAKLGLALVFFQRNDMVNTKKYLAQAREDEPRLCKGMKGIVELESEGFFYSKSTRLILRKLFEVTK
jgi:tetratricopeptide (TPR) repeat protein